MIFFCELCCGARKGEFLDPNIPATSYLRNTLTRVTHAFKKIWLPQGEKEKSGAHMPIVHEVCLLNKTDAANNSLKREKF